MIRVAQVSKWYGKRRVLQTVSLELPIGQIGLLYGPSGSGKTTLLRLIAGLDRPDEGEILLGGAVCSTPVSIVPPLRRHIGMVFQESTLWPHMTVAGNVSFGLLNASRRHRRERVKTLLECFDLLPLAQRYPSQLSGGQARRVAIARALAPDPAFLLLDEPLAHLDKALRGHVMEVVVEWARAIGSTVLMISHDPQEVEGVVNHCWRLCDGHITEV